ncbi:MAG: methyltransferase domain-containing protein [Alphaproteobacteria bacterium]|nr:methyltransferase domain-containing protein [Alphaproteobacteria bacterium]
MMSASHSATESEMKDAMDRMYRWTRHVYDLTRKYYLLGRDKAIAGLNAQPGERVCEVGCGTARNLIKMARRYPDVKFFGLDASDEMLKTAGVNLKKAGMCCSVPVTQAFAQSFLPQSHFGLEEGERFDKFVFSYALSIIPPWRESFDHALKLLPAGGEIHIIDFGSQSELPGPFRKFLFWWLKQFHVFYKPEIEDYLRQLATEGRGTLEFENLYGGYCYRAVFKKN